MSTKNAYNCYFFNCYELTTEIGKKYGINGWTMEEIIKPNTTVEVIIKRVPYQIKPGIGIDREFCFVIEGAVAEGWIIEGIDSIGQLNNYFPAYNTMDGWDTIHNYYYTAVTGEYLNFEDSKFLRTGKLIKDSLIEWINNEFPKLITELGNEKNGFRF